MMKIAVVGVGGTGSAACRHLAKAGHTVIGYERFTPGHTRGSSHGESRIIRYTYPDRLFTEMMGDAYPLWDELQEEAGEELFVRCGGLVLGRPDDPLVADSRDALAAVRLPYEELSPAAIADRFPAIHLRDGEIGLYQKDSGFLRSERCVLANVRLARRHGATIRENTEVIEIAAYGDTPLVRTGDGHEETFDGVLVTAGAWMGKLFRDLHLPLSVERRQVVYLDIDRHPERFAPDRFPVWINTEPFWYGFPTDGVIAGCKLASHIEGDRVDPDIDLRQPEERAIVDAVRFAQHRFPDLSDRCTATQVCLYTNTPNEDFVIDRVPGLPNVSLISGCSGHGFKFTVLLGKIGAGMVTGTPYARDLSRFTLKSFLSD
ncbi:MAG: N-methyl-L-tryptophan oxidase [Capsulimonadales bacterium]|nr:N-methyl-L-tryptophan oxidase [Capsulimonadales bacterium]